MQSANFISRTWEVLLLLAELPRSSSQLSGLSNSRSKAGKQDTKDRESREQAVELLFDRKRVPLEALVRKSSPIAMVKKEEPAEPQVCSFCL